MTTNTPQNQQDRINRERAQDVRALLHQWDGLISEHGAGPLGRLLDTDFQGLQEIIDHLRLLDQIETHPGQNPG